MMKLPLRFLSLAYLSISRTTTFKYEFFMKKQYFLLAICFSHFLFALPMQERQIDPEALSHLASELNVPLNGDLIEETQKQWLRQSGQERWDLKELSSDQKQFVLTWASEEGFFTAWQPIDSFYDKALILGATTDHMHANAFRFSQTALGRRCPFSRGRLANWRKASHPSHRSIDRPLQQ
jgi:hypothetical protein